MVPGGAAAGHGQGNRFRLRGSTSAGIEGRAATVLQTPAGNHVSSTAISHLFKDYPAVERYQLYQSTRDAVQVRIVPTPQFVPQDQARIREGLETYLGTDITIQFELMDEIPTPVSGKHHMVISDVPLEF